MKAKIIIGANWGDEGKGLATAYFSEGKCLNVLFNGGPQRGHTVELEDGTRHVFHHFGSGTFKGADTYFNFTFLVNPANFTSEYYELCTMGYNPTVYASPECRVITLYDVMVNQVVEESRGDNRHGSCGMGIWETVTRYTKLHTPRLKELTECSKEKQYKILSEIRTFAYNKIVNYYKLEIPETYKFLFESEELLEHYLYDLNEMAKIVKFVPDFIKADVYSYKDLLKQYDTVVFEGAQGLALDWNNKEEGDHVTASCTSAATALPMLWGVTDDVEICYITRTYLTRHGAGPFNECDKNEINPLIIDKTNVPNDYQKSIRYAKLTLEEYEKMLGRIFDSEKTFIIPHVNYTRTLFVTHYNYVDNIAGMKPFNLTNVFNKIYTCDNKFGKVKIYENN